MSKDWTGNKALSIVPDWKKVCVFLKIQFLEGKARRELFRQHPPGLTKKVKGGWSDRLS